MSGDSSTRPEIPPLRIHHLMVCAAVAAVQMSLWRTLMAAMRGNLSTSMSWDNSPVYFAWMAVSQSLGAVGLTLVLLSIYWQYRGLPAFKQPGQWLLLTHPIDILRFYFALLPFVFARGGTRGITDFFNAGNMWSFVFYAGGVAFQFVNPIILLLRCAWKIADSI
jgi:hypothetical protein